MIKSLLSFFILFNTTIGETTEFLESPIFEDINLIQVNQIPNKNFDAISPVIEAKAALVMDMGTGLFLYEKNAYTRLPMASLTKIMTAVLILENHKLDEIVTLNESYGSYGENTIGVSIWLRKGEQFTVHDLLKALLIRSSGDAALALADYHSGSVEKFVEEMNIRARELKLYDTNFVNPVGMDGEGHYSTAYDLSQLTKYALGFNAFKNIVRTKSETITSLSDGNTHELVNTNDLLDSYLDIRGVKTGTTDGAGQSVINLAVSPNGNEILAILLNSPQRFQENKSIIDWTFRSYKW